jgi:uncharacterized C2H2 Zn-finger protein
MEDNGASLTTQCLAFCQALASHGQAFTLALTIGSTFTFSLDTKEKKKKLPTPSTEKRNLRRREEFLNGKRLRNFQCNQCDKTFKTGEDLEAHTVKTHKSEDPTPTVKPAQKPVVIKTHKTIEEKDVEINILKSKYDEYEKETLEQFAVFEQEIDDGQDEINRLKKELVKVQVYADKYQQKCTKCKFTVASRDILKSHIENQHGQKVIICPKCNFVATSGSMLLNHTKNQHA